MAVQKKWQKKRKGAPPPIKIEPKNRPETEEEAAARVPDPQKPKGDDHLRLPSARVITSPVKGEFLALPVIGFMSVRDKVNTPLVMLILSLLKPTKQKDGSIVPENRGLLQVEIPFYKKTEMATVAALERCGWDGRLWPPRHEATAVLTDEKPRAVSAMEKVEPVIETRVCEKDLGWPEGDEVNKEQLQAFLEMVKVKRTFTFTPTEQGSIAQGVEVTRARGDFLMPPLPEPEEPPNPKLVEALQDILKEGVSVFYRY